jgi:hypothetical protein
MQLPKFQQVAIAFDQLINTLLGGMADETLSARAYRHSVDGTRKWPRWIIDHIFFWQPNHCMEAFLSEKKKAHLPKDYQ